MAAENQIVLVGNLTRDPELRMTNNDNALVNLGIAVNRNIYNNGQWEEKLDGFFNVTVWNDYARNVAQSLNKGDRVVVVGRMLQSTYKDQQGNDRQSFDIQADEIAPSLKWATAQVQRTRGGGNYNNAGGGGNYNNAGGSGNYNNGGGNYNNASGGGNYNNAGNQNAGNTNNDFPSPDVQPYNDGGAGSAEATPPNPF